MTISRHEAEVEEKQGKERGLAGGSLDENPHTITQGSPTRVLGLAWRRGFLEGQRLREISDAEQSGDLFRGTVSQ